MSNPTFPDRRQHTDRRANPPLTEEQIEFFTSQTNRAVKKALRGYVRSALVGFAILLFGVSYAIQGKSNTHELRAGLLSSCARVNILRAQSNTSDSVAFKILALSAIRERELAGLTHGAEHGTHHRSAVLLTAQASYLTITGLTDCEQAVDHAEDYAFPVANPVGNAVTAQISPLAQTILTDSQKLLAHVKATHEHG